MTRALWLSGVKPPKEFEVRGSTWTVAAIKNSSLEARLLPGSPEMLSVKAVMEWAELVRRVATAYGANAVLLETSLALPPLLFTLQYVLRPYKVTLQIIK